MPTIKNDKIYALYIRDKHICDGTLEEIALQTGRKRSQLLWMKNALKCKSSHYANIDISDCTHIALVGDSTKYVHSIYLNKTELYELITQLIKMYGVMDED